METKQSTLCLVGNIPKFYHARHLRTFFSSLIENCSFHVFHFRHRPEADNKNKKSGLFCVFLKVYSDFTDDFIRLYDGKHWLDQRGEESIPLRCKIIKLSSVKGSTLEKYNAYLKRREVENFQKRVGFVKVPPQNFIRAAESNLLEFNPPPDMPHGNVGTPTSFFVKLINECRLSVKVIQKLGLHFPRIRRLGKYSAVSFEYENIGSFRQTQEKQFSGSGVADQEEVVASNGRRLLNEDDYVKHERFERERQEEIEEYERKCKIDSMEITRNEKSKSQADLDDDDDTEEWDRFEALHDDPHNLNRGKCRRYEEELEVVWEKGGSGLVFYTDEHVWREKSQLEIFDEPTNYDWDVDTSVWYESGGGDKDAKDLVSIRLESRLEKGIDDGVESENFFNAHKQNVGRRLMEKLGWRPGERIGCANRNGLKTALSNDGQKPSDKAGLGYYGPKLIRRMAPDEYSVDEKNNHNSESLYRRSDPIDIIKYRSYKHFVPGQSLNP